MYLFKSFYIPIVVVVVITHVLNSSRFLWLFFFYCWFSLLLNTHMNSPMVSNKLESKINPLSFVHVLVDIIFNVYLLLLLNKHINPMLYCYILNTNCWQFNEHIVCTVTFRIANIHLTQYYIIYFITILR